MTLRKDVDGKWKQEGETIICIGSAAASDASF